MVRVIGVGDNTVDTYVHLGMMFPGGNTVNVPVLAHRYGHPASYIGWLGNDVRGQLILNALQEEAIDTSHCRVIEGPNAYCEISLVDGDRVFGQSSSGVCGQIALTEEDLDFISQHDLTHTSIYSAIEGELEKLSGASKHLSFDFSQDWSRGYLSGVLPWVTIAVISYPDHSESETEDLLRWIHAQGPAWVLATQGEQGATAYDGRRITRQGIVRAEVIDTLGAGDAFTARFLVEILDGAPIQAALDAGAQSAAATCSYYGAFGHGMPFE